MDENINNIDSKIDLLIDQIANIERSGFFTEEEVDRMSFCYKMELETLKTLKTTIIAQV
jgi:hypothetical protein